VAWRVGLFKLIWISMQSAARLVAGRHWAARTRRRHRLSTRLARRWGGNRI